MYSTYILYSKSKNQYYTGQCEDISLRLGQHNTGRNRSTKTGIPWEVVFIKQFGTRAEATFLESKIKKRGAGRFLDDLQAKRG
jgi:putative endonuclease